MRYTLLTFLVFIMVACHGGGTQPDRAVQPVKCVVAKPLHAVTRDFAMLCDNIGIFTWYAVIGYDKYSAIEV